MGERDPDEPGHAPSSACCPHHDRWGDVLHNLRYVVVDEAHVYRGVFGSHVANVLRRLRRLARAYGADPQFLLASATIANAGELALALTGEPAVVVGRDAAPRAEREIVLWNPPLVDPELGQRASALGEASRLLAGLVSRGLRTICFAKSRKAAELIHRFAAERVDAATARRLAPYRAGYTPQQRREIERRLVEGELLGVSATDALELGIDIGLLDCAISVGFPGTVASLRQQWGRAGRRERGLAVLIAGEDALDQFFMREPEALLSRTVEAALLDHANPRILDPHVYAAAFEGPLDEADAATLGPEALERAARAARARADAGRLGLEGPRLPGGADLAALRRRGGIHDRGRVERVGARPRRARARVLHRPRRRGLPPPRRAVPRPAARPRRAHGAGRAGDGRTGTRRCGRRRRPRSRRRCAQRPDWASELHFGRVSVTEQVVAYARKAIADGSTIEVVPLDLPETTFDTEAIWFSPGPALLAGLEEMPKLLSTLHAAEHSLIALLPLWAMCDRWDIGGLSTNVHFQTGEPTIFVYDGHAGGVGITARGFDRFEGWVADTARLLAGCPCAEGCPSCVQSPKCGNLNELLDKDGARTLLERMVETGTSHSS